jgi:hypothetical protein
MSNRSTYDDMQIGDVFVLDLGSGRVRIDTIEEIRPVFDGPRGADTVVSFASTFHRHAVQDSERRNLLFADYVGELEKHSAKKVNGPDREHHG